MSAIKVTIDGIPHEIEVGNGSNISVQQILLFGGKPKDYLEDFDLLKVMSGGEDVIVYSKGFGIGSLGGVVHVSEGDEFVIRVGEDKHGYTIIVDTRQQTWSKDIISYEDVVNLSVSAPYDSSSSVSYTIIYYTNSSLEGMSLVKGKTVKVQNEMVFNVSKSDKS